MIASVQSLGAIVVTPLLGFAVQRSGYQAPLDEQRRGAVGVHRMVVVLPLALKPLVR